MAEPRSEGLELVETEKQPKMSSIRKRYKELMRRRLQQQEQQSTQENEAECTPSSSPQLDQALMKLFETVDRETMVWIKTYSPYCNTKPEGLDQDCYE